MDTPLITSVLLSSSVAVAVVTGIKELLLWWLNRRAKVADDCKEDKEGDIQTQLDIHQDKIDRILEIVERLESSQGKLATSERAILKDRIKFIATKYIHNGEISYNDKVELKEMWRIYHFELGGNGDLDDIMSMIEELPLIV